MKIAEVYEKYQIPPWLALHMYRVAAVAATLFDARGLSEGRDELICAALLHDMGNVVKFNFDSPVLPMTEDEKEYWKKVKDVFVEKYSSSAHDATLKIIDEIGISAEIRRIVDTINFSLSDGIEHSDDMLVKILQYSDMRVVPKGVASLDARIEDMYIRYAYKRKRDDTRTQELIAAMKRMEETLFQDLDITPQDITEESTFLLREQMQSFDIGSVVR